MAVDTFNQRLQENREALQSYRIEILILAVIVGLILGWFLFAPEQPFARNSYLTNIFTEGISILITVYVVTEINKRRDIAEKKKRLVRQAGSVNHAIAINAIEELRENGWLINKDREHLLAEVRLWRANLEKAPLEYADLSGTNFWKANLRGVVLHEANLQNADLGFTNLKGARLRYANLSSADLGKADLCDAILWEANLHSAYLRQANLSDTDLRNANLCHAILEEVNLCNADLQDAVFDERTALPDAHYLGTDDDGKRKYDKYWTPDTDMTHYTDPNHPDFWQPNWAAAGFDSYDEWDKAGRPRPDGDTSGE